VHDSLKVLLLEDSEEDAELIVRELRSSGHAFTVRHVFLKPAFIAALDEFDPDILLVDTNVPGFDSVSAIKLVRSHKSTTPVIVVTGDLNDKATTELLRAGANDCVQKDDLAQLGPAIQRALATR
jgi:DNA-binding response OmpR family regulator